MLSSFGSLGQNFELINMPLRHTNLELGIKSFALLRHPHNAAVLVLYHSINHQYIENSESAAVGSHGTSELSKQKLLSIAKVKTSFDSFFRVEKMF